MWKQIIDTTMSGKSEQNRDSSDISVDGTYFLVEYIIIIIILLVYYHYYHYYSIHTIFE